MLSIVKNKWESRHVIPVVYMALKNKNNVFLTKKKFKMVQGPLSKKKSNLILTFMDVKYFFFQEVVVIVEENGIHA